MSETSPPSIPPSTRPPDSPADPTAAATAAAAAAAAAAAKKRIKLQQQFVKRMNSMHFWMRIIDCVPPVLVLLTTFLLREYVPLFQAIWEPADYDFRTLLALSLAVGTSSHFFCITRCEGTKPGWTSNDKRTRFLFRGGRARSFIMAAENGDASAIQMRLSDPDFNANVKDNWNSTWLVFYFTFAFFFPGIAYIYSGPSHEMNPNNR
jgi:hypothetical protein